jgi:hypothetical protein
VEGEGDMTSKTITTFLLLMLLTEAVEARTSLYKAEAPTDVKMTEDVNLTPPQNRVVIPNTAPIQTPPLAKKVPKAPATVPRTNEDGISQRSYLQVPQGNSTLRAAGVVDELIDLKFGEIYQAVIPMSVMAFKDAKAPVVANLEVQGSILLLLGEATLEKNSKRITIEFQKVRRKEGEKIFDLKASVLSYDGTLGLEAEIHSGEGKYFLAEVLSAGAAGFVDASVNRSSSPLGGTVDERSLDTQGKKALSGAMMKSSERFAEKVKTAPEYATVDGPVLVNVLVSAAATRKY